MSAPVEAMLAQIGEWKFPESKFVYKKNILLKQTNAIGNTYFSNYIEWQGEAREQLFFTHPAARAFMAKYPNILMITHTLHHRFHQNTFAGDQVRIEVQTRNILTHSLMIIFKYYNENTNVLIGEGWQKICFFDQAANSPCKIPQLFLDIAKPICETTPESI